MGMIINIDEALSQNNTYNLLKEPLNKMLMDMQEAWERENPIDLLFTRGTLDSFQETYASTIGFDHAFKETSDYAVAPIFNTADGFAATYTSRTFQGGFIITEQVLEDKKIGVAMDVSSQFMKRWHGDIVEFCMVALSSGFGVEQTYGDDEYGESQIQLFSADTTDGKITTVTKVPLFSNAHTIVARKKGETLANEPAVTAVGVKTKKQSNLFYADLKLGGSDAGQVAKLADTIYQVISMMENYRDDNGKRAGVIGPKRIVCGNDPRLKGYINAALSAEEFGPNVIVNHARDIATLDSTPYLLDIPQCEVVDGCGRGFFIIDPAYNAANHGLELTERVPLTMNVERKKNPYGISYDGRQRFNVNVCSWRGIAYVYIGTPAGAAGAWDNVGNFTKITPVDTVVKDVNITNNPLNTKASS